MQRLNQLGLLKTSRLVLGALGQAKGGSGAGLSAARGTAGLLGRRGAQGAPLLTQRPLSSSSVAEAVAKLYVVTLNGADRRGIVHRFTAEVANHGGNFEESRMVRLGGEFVVMSLLTVSESRVQELREAVQRAFPDYAVTCRETREEPVVEKDLRTLQVSVEGPDQRGIIRSLTEALVPFQAHIESMETETVPAPFAGWPLFRLRAHVSIPRAVSVESVEEALAREVEEKFDMMVDVSSLPGRRARGGAKKPTDAAAATASAQHAS